MGRADLSIQAEARESALTTTDRAMLELIALRQRQGFSTWRFTVMSTMGSLPVTDLVFSWTFLYAPTINASSIAKELSPALPHVFARIVHS